MNNFLISSRVRKKVLPTKGRQVLIKKGIISEKEISSIVREFSIDIDATQKVAFSNQVIPATSSVFRLIPEKISNPLYKDLKLPNDVYILHSPDIVEIACFPHLVGEELDKRCLRIGKICAKVIQKLWLFDETTTLIYDVLRAGPGYRIWEGLKNFGIDLKRIKIRPHYKIVSYRSHDLNSHQLETIFKNFSALPSKQELTIIKPDTEASGRTSILAIEELVKEAKIKHSKIKEIIFTGYISVPSLSVLRELADKYNFKAKILAWGNLTALYDNNYDMPIYGLDESVWREKGELRKLGSIIPLEILRDYLKYYIPGADQPGDWSARQSFIDTGLEMEPGGIPKHLENSLKFINNLYELSKCQSWYRPWHEKIFQNELETLKQMINQKPLL